MLHKILFRFFWNTYDSLGGWLILSAAAFALCLPVVTAPAAWGALLGAAARADCEEEISLRLFWRDFRHFGRRSTLLGLIALGAAAVWLANLYFYTAPVTARLPFILRINLLCFFFWVGLFALIGLEIGWAFMVMQDLPVKKALKRGFLALLAQPIPALAAFFLMLLVTVAMSISVLGAVVLLGGLRANLILGIAAGTVEFYEEIEDKKERERLEKGGARSWHELRSLDERAAARHRRYNRGWKDILRPWGE